MKPSVKKVSTTKASTTASATKPSTKGVASNGVVEKKAAPAQKSAGRMGRPTAEQSKLLDDKVKTVALGLFLDQGFDSVTMEAVASSAGITKRSLYARYKDKAELFSAALKASKNDWAAKDADQVLMAGKTLEAKLLAAAKFLMEHTLNPKFIKLSRTAAAKAMQFPEEIRRTYDISLSPRTQSVVKILQAHESEIDPACLKEIDMTAELFVGLITGIPAKLASYGTIRDSAEEGRRVKLAVRIFLQGIAKP